MATGVLLLNLGGPTSPEDVPIFLRRLFSDTTFIPIPFGLGKYVAKLRTGSVKKQYEAIGGSPLLYWTLRQGEGMAALLDEISPETAPHRIYPCFRYAEPLAEQAMAAALADGVQRLVAFTQYPQYCCVTTGNSMCDLYTHGFNGSVVWRWGDHPRFIEAWVQIIKSQLGCNTTMPVVFSAHGIPAKTMWKGDAYVHEVGNTVYCVMRELENPFRICWQSKVGLSQWVEPSIEDTLKLLARTGVKEALVVPIAFTSEHLETLFELDLEVIPYAKKLGITDIKRCPAPNDHPTFIRA